MQKVITAVAFCTALALVGCGKSNNAEQAAGASPAPVSERGSSLTEQAVQAGREAGSAIDEKAEEIGKTVSDKSTQYYDTAKTKTEEVIDATQEKGSEMIERLNKE